MAKDTSKMKKPADKHAGIIQDITNRYRVTAREARDIVTAVANVGRAKVQDTNAKKNIFTGDAVKIGRAHV